MADKPNTDGAPAPTPDQEVRRLYEEAESRVAKAAERVVSRDSFGELLAMVTENVVSLTRIGNEAMDLVLRNLRVASRQDINRLTRALPGPHPAHGRAGRAGGQARAGPPGGRGTARRALEPL